MTSYERIAERLLRGQPKAKPFGKLIDGKFLTGTKSQHLTKQSRAWRKFWKMTQNKMYKT